MAKDMTQLALKDVIAFIKRKRSLEKKKIERDLTKQATKKTIEFLEHVRTLRERTEANKRKSKEKESTLILACKCNDGVVMIADKRSMRGTEYKEEKKINEFYKVIIAFAGLTGLKDKFLEMVEGVLRGTRAVNLSEAIIGVEDTMATISERYEQRLRGGARIEALLAGLEHLTSGDAKLYHVFAEGYAEEVDFLCIGHGAPYATCLAQGLHDSSKSMEKMAEMGIFLIGWVENVDSSVGGIPDVVFVENNEGIKSMEGQKIEQIYKNTQEIAKKLPQLLPKAIQDPKVLESQKK